jgi:hypothetical protein
MHAVIKHIPLYFFLIPSADRNVSLWNKTVQLIEFRTRERVAVSKKRPHKFHEGSLNLNKLNEVENKGQYRVKVKVKEVKLSP